jgi:Rieske Fe-S protein
MTIDRRSVLKQLKNLALAGAVGPVVLEVAQAQAAAPAPYRVAPASAWAEEWAVQQFPFDGRHAVALRVPSRSDKRPLVVTLPRASGGEDTLYLVAYHLVCTHLGCTPALPNAAHQLLCPCHGSTFEASDGRAADNRPNPPLRAIRLEVRAGMVVATGYLE